MIHCSMASLHEAVNCRVFLGNSFVVALFLKNGGMAKLCEDESEAKRNWACRKGYARDQAVRR